MNLAIGNKYTGAQLRKLGVWPQWHPFAKTRCKWEVLDISQFTRNTHGGNREFALKVTLRGKPPTKAGKPRKHPIKYEWVFSN
jgi:hypothetical protein